MLFPLSPLKKLEIFVELTIVMKIDGIFFNILIGQIVTIEGALPILSSR